MAIKQHKVYFFIQSIADSFYLFAFWSPCLLCLIIPCLLCWYWSLSKVLMLFLFCFSYQRLINWYKTKASFIIYSSKRSFETSKWCIVFLFWTRWYDDVHVEGWCAIFFVIYIEWFMLQLKISKTYNHQSLWNFYKADWFYSVLRRINNIPAM